eukprot:gb/GECG01016834.1/.p1 GENE.gb/GECG01016834.1/~~gb/GECG01016834.1/.p1  ORF type:complete len:331 (+),score=63.36 gb/GECG01016834.1/:1-993(+)
MSGETSAEEIFQNAQQEADKFVVFGKSKKHQRAADLFEQAGDAYRLQGSPSGYYEAIRSFEQAIKQLGKNNDTDQILHLQQKIAATYISSGDLGNAEETYESYVMPALDQEKRHVTIGKLYEQLAEARIKETDKRDIEKAIGFFDNAISRYSIQEDSVNKRNAKHKLAEVYAREATDKNDQDKFQRAMEHYRDCGNICLSESLSRFNAKKYFVSAIYCALACGDLVVARRLVDSANKDDPSFERSREGSLCNDVVSAAEEKDQEKFVEALKEYDEVARLGELEMKILLCVKRDIGDETGGTEEDVQRQHELTERQEGSGGTEEEGLDSLL